MIYVVMLFATFIVLAFLYASISSSEVKNLQNEGLGSPAGARTDDDVKKLLFSGNKIQAIKLYREIHNVGLAEAKEAVERFE